MKTSQRSPLSRKQVMLTLRAHNCCGMWQVARILLAALMPDAHRVRADGEESSLFMQLIMPSALLYKRTRK